MEELDKKILYIDMDGVICDYNSAYKEALQKNPDIKYPQSQIGFFYNIKPLKLSNYISILNEYYDLYFLTRPSVKNPMCYTEKRLWIEKHYGYKLCEKLIITPNKTLNKGDYLVDDNFWKFDGKLLLLGSEEFPTYEDIYMFLLENYLIDNNG